MPQHSVVILEDDPTARLLLRRLCERKFDCVVADAADGPEGLALVREVRPDLVILDIHLPSMSGVEVLQEMRADPGVSGTACVVITAASQRPVIEQLVTEQVRDILLKPLVLARDEPRLRRVFAQLPSKRNFVPLF